MSRSIAVRYLLACSLLALLTGCSRDPNVRKQKYFDSGEKYFAEGKYHEAAIQYSNAIQIDSRFAQAHYQLGQTFLKLGDSSRAFQELNRTVDLVPDNYRAHTDLANLLTAARNPDGSPMPDALKQAKTHLDFLRDRQPNRPETHEAWAYYDEDQNDIGGAIREAQQAITLNPNRSESYLLLALLQLHANLFDQAEASFNKAIIVDPKAMNAQMALGAFYQARSRLPEAEQQFRRSISIDPKNPAPRVALMRLLVQEGRKAEAESFLQQTKKDLPDNPEAYGLLGNFYLATGDYDKAVVEYASLYHDHPEDIQVKKNYIQLLILKNRLDEATKLNNEVLKASPDDADALVYKGELQLRQNNAGAAVNSLQRAIHNNPDNALAHYQLGIAFDQQHNQNSAEAEWRVAVRLRPDLTDAQRALAVLERRRGDLDALLETAQQIIKAQPYSADGFLIKCIAEIDRQRYSDAQKDAEQAMQKAPQSPAPYFQMGNIHLAQKQYADAVKFYQQALDKDPSFALGLSGLIDTYLAQKKFDQAIAAAQAQIAKSPNNSSFYDLLGTALFDARKDLPGAEAALRHALELDQNNSDALEKLGKVQVAEGSLDQAIALYQKSIKDNPGNVRLYVLSGEFYEQKQDWDHAKAMYQQALALQPDQPLASNNLAYLILEHGGNVDVALALAQAARRANPDSAAFADTLGWTFYHKGLYQSAIDLFQVALQLGERPGLSDDSTTATFHYHLGLAYQKANQNALARQQLEKAVKLSPSNADAKKALSELHG